MADDEPETGRVLALADAYVAGRITLSKLVADVEWESEDSLYAGLSAARRRSDLAAESVGQLVRRLETALVAMKLWQEAHGALRERMMSKLMAPRPVDPAVDSVETVLRRAIDLRAGRSE